MSIPVPNIWWLMLYASDLGKSATLSNLAAEALPDDIPDLVAEILPLAGWSVSLSLLTAAAASPMACAWG